MKLINITKANKEKTKKKFYTRFKDNIKYLPRNEMDLLLNHIKLKDIMHRKRNHLMFSLLLSMGCRITEFTLIEIKHIDFSIGLIKIPAENTKTKQSRSVRVNPGILLDLKDYIHTNNIKNGYLFRNKQNMPITPRNYNDLLKKYYDDIKDKLTFKPHCHTFRHSHVVYALDNKVPMPAIMKQVGHIRLTTTQIYADIAGSHVKEMYKEVDF